MKPGDCRAAAGDHQQQRIIPTRLAIRTSPPTIALMYLDNKHHQKRRVRSFFVPLTARAQAHTIVDNLLHTRERYFNTVPRAQLLHLVQRLIDHDTTHRHAPTANVNASAGAGAPVPPPSNTATATPSTTIITATATASSSSGNGQQQPPTENNKGGERSAETATAAVQYEEKDGTTHREDQNDAPLRAAELVHSDHNRIKGSKLQQRPEKEEEVVYDLLGGSTTQDHDEHHLDLNKVSPLELAAKKDEMDILFQKNIVRKGDENFVYNVEKNFEIVDGNAEDCGWDDDDDEEEDQEDDKDAAHAVHNVDSHGVHANANGEHNYQTESQHAAGGAPGNNNAAVPASLPAAENDDDEDTDDDFELAVESSDSEEAQAQRHPPARNNDVPAPAVPAAKSLAGDSEDDYGSDIDFEFDDEDHLDEENAL